MDVETGRRGSARRLRLWLDVALTTQAAVHLACAAGLVPEGGSGWLSCTWHLLVAVVSVALVEVGGRTLAQRGLDRLGRWARLSGAEQVTRPGERAVPRRSAPQVAAARSEVRGRAPPTGMLPASA